MADKRAPPPLDEEALRELALRYVGRFATSRAKLHAYLGRKIKERGWGGEGPADPQALVDRLSDLKYVDDASYAAMKSASLARRGYGARRVAETLRADGIAEADREEADARTASESWQAADRFARLVKMLLPALRIGGGGRAFPPPQAPRPLCAGTPRPQATRKGVRRLPPRRPQFRHRPPLDRCRAG